MEFPGMTPYPKPPESSRLFGHQDPVSLAPPDPTLDQTTGGGPVTDLETTAATARGSGTGLPPLFSDTGTWVLILNGLLLAGFLFWLLFRGEDEAQIRLIGDLTFVFLGLCQVGMFWRASLAPGLDRRTRQGWRLFTLGFAFYLVGGSLWFYYEVVLVINPFPSWADLCYLALYPPLLAGIAFFLRPRESRAERIQFWLDLGVVAIGAGTLVWYFLLLPIAKGDYEDTLALALSQAYPLFDTMIMVGIAALLLKRRTDRSIAPVVWLVAGLIAFFIADTRYAYDNAQGIYLSGGVTDLLYHLSTYLTMVAAWREFLGTSAVPPRLFFRNTEWLLDLLPYFAVAAVYGLLLALAFGWSAAGHQGPGDEALSGTILAAVVIAALVMIRQSVATREIARLQALQAAREAEALQAAEAAHRARNDTEERLHRLTEVAPDAILMMDDKGLITYWNPAATTILGYRAEEALGQNLHQLLAPERFQNAQREGFAAFIHSGRGPALDKTIELYARRQDGQEIAIELSLASFAFDDGWNAVGIIRDVTQRKNIEQGLMEAKQQAEAANRAKSAFLANMSHEIRTPMNGIIGMAQLAMRTDLDPRQRDYVSKIENSARSLLGILNDILDLSKIEAGKLETERTPFDLTLLVEKVMHLVEVAAHDKGLALSLDYAPDLDRFFEGDPLRLSQILTNLLSNAVKFTAAGEVHLAIRDPAHQRLRFEVSDTGIGLTTEERQRLFQAFSQADSSTTRKFGGTGLGLFITQQLVELMNGTIEVTSEPGQGSCFSVEIEAPVHTGPIPAMAGASPGDPAGRADVADILLANAPPQAEDQCNDRSPDRPGGDPQARPQHAPAPGLAGKRLLLAEDNPLNQEIVLGFLADTGLRIDIAGDGRQALTLFQITPYDLVLMDIQMPIMDGYEASQRIRALDPQIPIIALTANAFNEDMVRSLQAGMNEHLSKPLDREQLLGVLSKFLAPTHQAGGRAGKGQALDLPVSPTVSEGSIPAPGQTPAVGECHFDPERGQALMGGNLPLYTKILGNFAQAYSNLQLDLAAPEDRRTLHSLKGLSGHIGADRLRELAIELEQRTEDRALLADFQREMTAVLADIRVFLATRSAPETPRRKESASPALIHQLFEEIRHQAQASNSRNCRSAIDRLHQLQLSPEEEALLKQASELLNGRNYQAMTRL